MTSGSGHRTWAESRAWAGAQVEHARHIVSSSLSFLRGQPYPHHAEVIRRLRDPVTTGVTAGPSSALKPPVAPTQAESQPRSPGALNDETPTNMTSATRHPG